MASSPHHKKLSQIHIVLDRELTAKSCDWSCDKLIIVSGSKNATNAYKEEIDGDGVRFLQKWRGTNLPYYNKNQVEVKFVKACQAKHTELIITSSHIMIS